MPKMTEAQSDAFLRETRIAKLATLKNDGSPTIVPVWFEWDGTTAVVFTSRNSAKVGRIRRDPRVALSVEEPVAVPEAWVTLEGKATIEESGGIELARRLAPRYYGPERAASALESWEKMAADWVVLRITPARIRSSV
jgi:PPOX class probable F420-dependent enzyme